MIAFREQPFDPVTEFDDALAYIAELQREYVIPVMAEGDVEKWKASMPPMRIIKP